MVTARFDFKQDEFITMTVKGHAGFAELGEDPVCAGASTLAMTVAQCIQSMGEQGKLRKKPNITVRNGHVSVTAKPKPESFSEAFHAFYVGEIGMQLLAESYPEHVEFIPFVPPEEGADNKKVSPT